MIHHIRPVTSTLIMGFLVFLIVNACSNDTSETTRNASSRTCAVTFDLTLAEDSGVLSGNTRQMSALALDCSEIDTVTADISTLDGVPLQNGGPWDCETGSGIIQNVPAGIRGMVVVLCKSAQGEVIYRGESVEIDLIPGRTVSAGAIEADSFVPDLMLPADANSVTNGNAFFQWSEVQGAVSYIVSVTAGADTNDLNSPYLFMTTDTSYRTHEIVTGLSQYFWKVRAVDASGNLGSWSTEWSFTTNDNTIPSAQIVSPVDAGQMYGHILFHCSPDMYDTYYDLEDFNNVSIAWRSNIDGVIGTGESCIASLTPGLHIITLAVTDQDGAVGYTKITLTVLSVPPTLGTGTWNYEQINGAGCDEYYSGWDIAPSLNISADGENNYDLTFPELDICFAGMPCDFSCTQPQEGVHLCQYAYEDPQMGKATSTIQFYPNQVDTAAGQGTTVFEQDLDGNGSYETVCQRNYFISFTR